MKASQVVRVVVAVVAVIAMALVFGRECAYGGGMAGWYRSCECNGLESLDYDRTAADGPRRTVCLGVVTKRKCHRYPGGPEVACELLPPR